LTHELERALPDVPVEDLPAPEAAEHHPEPPVEELPTPEATDKQPPSAG
jgi:hypothetical protein